MKKYINSALIGLGIASFFVTMNSFPYLGGRVIYISLAQGIAQGLVVPLIYASGWRLAYIYKFLIHALVSYLLALGMALLISWPGNLLIFTASWLLIFAVIFAYFYFTNHRAAASINEKLKKRTKDG